MARRQKLKVFRTSTGFHDAYVAAPSRKAALEAWGSDADLFSRGVAEQVADEELSREPLENPGKVIRRLRGTVEEQLAAFPANKLRRDRPRPASDEVEETLAVGRRPAKPLTGGATPAQADVLAASPHRPGKSGRKRTVRAEPIPRPSRAKLEEAERDLKTIVERQKLAESDIQDRLSALEEERRAIEMAHERERRTAERAAKEERERHSQLLNEWIAAQG